MVSVCIATYNGETYIKEQLESILVQLLSDDEVIISDDGSTDNTLKIVDEINDSRVKVFRNGKSKGVIGNVGNSLEKSKGEIIFLSDQDDVWLPGKVKIMTAALKDTDLVISDCMVTNENLKVIHDSFQKLNKSKHNKWLALIKNPYLGCCMAFNRKVLNFALPFPEKIPMHDIWIGNVAAFYYDFQLIPDKLILYRRHGKNTSTSSEPSENNIFKKIQLRINLAVCIYSVKNRKSIHK